MSPLLLTLLALLDGALLGFRAAAGRNGLVEKRGYYLHASLRGFVATALVALIGIAIALALCALRGPELWNVLANAASSAVQIFGAFAALVVLGLTAWMIPSADLRTLLTVTILGPGTLARPLVILAGLGACIATAPRWEVVALGAYGAFAMLSLERILTRRYYPIDASLFEAR